jgi:hypothetical protein
MDCQASKVHEIPLPNGTGKRRFGAALAVAGCGRFAKRTELIGESIFKLS